MRDRLLVLVIGLASCHRGSSRLEGHWVGQKATGVSGEALSAANYFASEMELDVHNDAIVVKTEHDKQTGRFRVVREDKTSVTIVTDEDGPTDEQTFTFDTDKSMTWSVLKDKGIVFSKK